MERIEESLRGTRDPQELKELIDRAQARFDAMSPTDQAIHQLEQRRSWIRGEMMLPREEPFDGQGMTEDQANTMLRKIAPEFVLLDELSRLKAELNRKDAALDAIEKYVQAYGMDMKFKLQHIIYRVQSARTAQGEE